MMDNKSSVECKTCEHHNTSGCTNLCDIVVHERDRRPHAEDVAYVSCVKHRYEDGTTVELCGMDFCAHRGERTVLLGPNGSGKSTLLMHLLGVLQAQEGTVQVLGHNPATEWTAIRQRIGVVLQNVNQQLIMPTVFDDVAFSLRQFGVPAHEVSRRVNKILENLELSYLSHRTPQSLSGGEKRRVALAGALVIEPELLILDEPFEGLDPKARLAMVALIHDLSHNQGVSIIMSTHDIDAVAELGDYCYVLKSGGEIALAGTPAHVFSHVATLKESNIRPPILAELFSAINKRTLGEPTLAPALTIENATDALLEWNGKRQ